MAYGQDVAAVSAADLQERLVLLEERLGLLLSFVSDIRGLGLRGVGLRFLGLESCMGFLF